MVLRRIAELGVRLSLDDGGRAASFAALRVLPLDELKIDAAFVHGLGRSETDAALVRGLVEIGHSLGLDGRRRGRGDAGGMERRSSPGAATARRASTSRARAPPPELADWLREPLARGRVRAECLWPRRGPPARRTRRRRARGQRRARDAARSLRRAPSLARRASRPGSRRRDPPRERASRCPRSPNACVANPATPRRKPTTRFVPAARRTSSPTERTSAGIRSVPRITPTAPPSSPIRNASTPPRPTRSVALRAGRDRAQREVDPAPDEHGRDQPVEQRLGDVVRERGLPRSRRRPTVGRSRRRRASRRDPRARASGRRRRRPPPRSRCSSRRPRAGCPWRGRSAAAGACRARARASTRSSRRRTRRRTLGGAPRLPERLLPALRGIRGAGEDEEEVGEAVQVDERERVHARRCPRPRAPRARRAGRSCGRRAAGRPPRCPPGRTKLLSSGRSALKRSQSCSSASTCACVDAQPALVLERHGEVGAEVEELVLHAREHVARCRRGSRAASTSPSAALTSSVAPYAAIRASSFDTREPSPSEVSPASPPRV